MADLTDDEKARQARADAGLRAAILEHSDAYFEGRDGELLADFLVVTHWVSDDGDSYTVEYEGAHMAVDRKLGLLRTATVMEEDKFRRKARDLDD